MKNKPLRVGFDLDGVLLYNPARIARLPVSIVKRFFLKNRRLKFYYPRSGIEKRIWRLLHFTSIFMAPGMAELHKLIDEGKVEAYVITGRYSFLEKDFFRWIQKLDKNHVFKGTFFNHDDEQPHLFKEKMVKKLKIDVFVEDNYDIVKHLAKKTEAKIFWIYNLLDRNIEHPYKFPFLSRAISRIKKML